MAHKRVLLLLLAALAVGGASVAVAQASTRGRSHRRGGDHSAGGGGRAATPIKHVVVIFQENVSFDHYFGTYPNAANTDGQTFHAAPGTPAVDGLTPATSHSLPPNLRHSTNLLTSNPNTAQPQRLDSSPTGAERRRRRTAHLRPGPQLQRRAAGVRQRQDGPLRPERRHRRRQHQPVRHPVPGRAGHGLLRRQHRHRAVELRPALLDERQLVRHDVRALVARRDQPRLRRHRQRRHRPHGQQPVGLDVHLARRRHHARRQGRLLADQRRPAVLGRLLDARRRGDERHQHRRRAQRRGLSWGWFQGGFGRRRAISRGAGRDRRTADSRPARSSRSSSRRASTGQNVPPTPPTRRSATRCIRSASRSAAPASGATRTTTSPTTSRSSTTPRRPTRIT